MKREQGIALIEKYELLYQLLVSRMIVMNSYKGHHAVADSLQITNNPTTIR